MVGHALVDQSSDLESLSHGIELGRRAQVAQECSHDLGITQVRDGVDEFIETRRRLGARVGGNYLSTGHACMLIC